MKVAEEEKRVAGNLRRKEAEGEKRGKLLR